MSDRPRTHTSPAAVACIWHAATTGRTSQEGLCAVQSTSLNATLQCSLLWYNSQACFAVTGLLSTTLNWGTHTIHTHDTHTHCASGMTAQQGISRCCSLDKLQPQQATVTNAHSQQRQLEYIPASHTGYMQWLKTACFTRGGGSWWYDTVKMCLVYGTPNQHPPVLQLQWVSISSGLLGFRGGNLIINTLRAVLGLSNA